MDADQIILERIVQGDLSAFDELYSKYGQQLYVFIFRHLRTAQEAEEVLQETFLRLLENQKEPSSAGSLKAWLYTVARNLSLNRLRAGKVAHEKQPELTTMIKGMIVDDVSEVNQKWAAKEVESLPPRLKQMFELRSSGQSYEEMANYLGVPVGTVKSRMFEMVRTLRERWKTWNVN